MKTCTSYEALRKGESTGLVSTMNSAEREEAWLKAGLARTDTDRFKFLMRLMTIHTVFNSGNYCRQYF
jgi:hypothetical protein